MTTAKINHTEGREGKYFMLDACLRVVVMMVAVGCAAALTSCSPASNQRTEVLDLTMPICSTRTVSGWPDPPYKKEIKFRVPANMLRMQPSPAEWPVGSPPENMVDLVLIRQVDEVTSPADSTKTLVDTGLNTSISNLPPQVDFKVSLLTDASLMEKIVGYRDGYVVMKNNFLPPFFRKPNADKGFWVWERPEKWVTEEKGLQSAKDTIFDRVFQPVGLEDKVVMKCGYHRYPPSDFGTCRVFTALDTGIENSCERTSLEYHFSTRDMSTWRKVDTSVRKNIHALILSPSVKFNTVDGQP
jgi:hypothetical protein